MGSDPFLTGATSIMAAMKATKPHTGLTYNEARVRVRVRVRVRGKGGLICAHTCMQGRVVRHAV